MNQENTEIQGTLYELAKLLENGETTHTTSHTRMSRSDETTEKYEVLTANKVREEISTDDDKTENTSVYHSQYDPDEDHINSYLYQLGNILDGREDAETQIIDRADQDPHLSQESMERTLQKEEPQLSQKRTLLTDSSLNKLQSFPIRESERELRDFEKVETAGILEELLETLALKKGNQYSVKYKDLLAQLEFDRTDPKAVKELHQLLDRLTEQRIPEKPGKSITEQLEIDDLLDEEQDDPVSQPMTKLEQQIDESEADKTSLVPLLSNLNDEPSVDSPKKPKMRRGPLWGLSLLIIGFILVPWGIYQYLNMTERRRIEKQFTKILDASPELAFYRIKADARGQILSLTGKLPSQHLRDRAATIAALAAPNLVLDNQIIVVDRPADMIQVAAEVEQVVKILNQIYGIRISAKFDRGNVLLEGTSIQDITIKNITQVFEQIPGVRQVSNQMKIQPVSVAIRIYFNYNSAEIPENDLDLKILQIKELLQKYPNLKLKLIGYTDKTERSREALALERAQAVETLLEDRGIDRRRIEAVGSQGSPPDIASNQERWLSRCVVFEIIQSDFDSTGE